MASSSTHHHQPQRWNYDVFLSFRGDDTRKNFVDHLYTALKQKGIHVFKDDKELERGEEISPELLKAIVESRFSIIIFSANYAFSKWCLDELVEIMDCTKQTGHKAFPIFYKVDPSHVRKQTGTYGEAFLKHENEHFEDKIEKIQRWRTALTDASNKSGWDFRDRHEAELIQEIVEYIFFNLKHGDLLCEDNIVGMDFHMKEMDTLLSKHSNDVRFIGIYGLGGIGKTTIAKATYDRISYQFEGCSYLADVRESSKQHNGLVNLQKQLLCDILKVPSSELKGDTISGVIRMRLRSKKVLVILDDVDHIDHLEGLAGRRDWFGSGSRIIITTRDKHLLDVHGVVERYKVKALGTEKSLELFSWNAFKRNHPEEDFKDLSNVVVNYTKGLPLALKILGSLLCGRKEGAWVSALDKLETEPNKEIVQILKISYDGLDETEKKIFLDIACFFKGKDKEYVTNILDSCGFFPGIGIQVLKERSLITVSYNNEVLMHTNEVLMHDLVQDMGREIVRQECPEYPGRRSRLWLDEDICYVLKNNVGTEAVEAIVMERPFTHEPYENWPSLQLSSKSFKKMCKLRLLQIHNVRIEIPRGLTNLSDDLRILHWQYCPLEYLPSTFMPDKLVELKMPHSRIKQLWNGIKILKNLKSVNLSWSKDLTEIPDLTEAPNLEVLNLQGATKLSKLHTSVGRLRRLKHLYLSGSKDLTEIPDLTEAPNLEVLNLQWAKKLSKLHTSVGLLRRLKYLSLSCCSNLSSFPSRIEMESLETLDLSCCTSLKELPSSINNIPKLKVLNLARCSSLECLPNSICGLKHLEELLLFRCWKLKKLPEKLGDLESLVKLEATGTAIKEVPLLCSLTYLDLRDCNLSNGMIPDDIGRLSSLIRLYLSGNMFVELPSSICQLTRLTTLYLDGCKQILVLPELPPSIEKIHANDCESLERLPNPSTEFKSTKDVCFSFVNCIGICKTQPSLTDVVQLFEHQARFGNSKTFSLTLPGNDIPEWFSHQSQNDPSPSPSPIDTQSPTHPYKDAHEFRNDFYREWWSHDRNDPFSEVMQLPSNWFNSKLRGLAFCVVVGRLSPVSYYYKVTVGPGSEYGALKISTTASSVGIPINGYRKLRNDHLVMGYFSRAWLRGKENESGLYFKGYKARVIKCGIRLVYSEDDVVDEKKKAKFLKGSPKLRRSLKRKRSMSTNLWHRLSKRVLLRFTRTRKKRKLSNE